MANYFPSGLTITTSNASKALSYTFSNTAILTKLHNSIDLFASNDIEFESSLKHQSYFEDWLYAATLPQPKKPTTCSETVYSHIQSPSSTLQSII